MDCQSFEKLQKNAFNAAFLPFERSLWGDIGKNSEKSSELLLFRIGFTAGATLCRCRRDQLNGTFARPNYVERA